MTAALRAFLWGGACQGLLLDMDGTLIDSEPASRAAYRAFFAARGWAADDRLINAFMGRRAPDVFSALPGPWASHDPHELARESLTFVDHERHPPVPLPGAAELLASARGRVPAAVVTSAPRWWVERAFTIVGEPLPSAVIAAENAPAGKPDPAPYRLAAALLGAEPEACLAVEDSVAGIQSARRAGVGTVLGLTTTAPAEVLARAGAQMTGPDLRVLLQHGN